MFIDTHAHLYAKAFDADRKEMIARAIGEGVDLFLLPNIDRESIGPMLELAAAHPQRCLPMIGLHPTSVKADYEAELAEVAARLETRDWLAVGEIGIDLYWDDTFVAQQRDAFLRQARWAFAKDRPIVIHSRESIDLIIELLQELGSEMPRGVFHCFTGDARQARQIRELGYYLGLGGVLTFKNSGLDQVIREVPLESLLLETDAPYLAPVPHRGKRNESAYVVRVAEKLAEIKDIPLETIATETTSNAIKLFRLDRYSELIATS
jgi:TatD DNase family protein